LEASQPISYTSYCVEKRKSKRVFLNQIAEPVCWEAVLSVPEKYYPTGQAAQGRKVYPALVLFKMTLLQTWYNLSDYGIEEQVNDTLSIYALLWPAARR
jgi:IS5 family transposase